MAASDIYVQFGCGFSAPQGWRNFDASPTLRFERLPFLGQLYTRNAKRFPSNVEYGDVRNGLPVPSGTCAGVYASHVLEHLSLEDFDAAIKETFRILRSGGIFRLVVPDLYDLARAYVDSHDRRDVAASHEFMRGSYLGHESRKRGVGGFIQSALGNSEHLWMWDELSLAEALRGHGFVEVRRAQFGDSADPAFASVEDKGRFERACAMQAVKP